MSSITREHTYDNINGCFEYVGYHSASCAAIRTKAVIIFKKQAQLMFSLHLLHNVVFVWGANSTWLLSRNNQLSENKKGNPGTRCDQSRENTDAKASIHFKKSLHHIMICVVIALHMEVVRYMHTHNEHVAFLFVSDVKLSVTEVFILGCSGGTR